MNQLSDYITERIRIDNIKQVDWVDFPVTGTPEQIKTFLLSASFKELPSTYTIHNTRNAVSAFNKEHTNIFYYGIFDHGGIIRFADTTYNEISEDNPMYEMWYYKRWYDRNIKPDEFIIVGSINKDNVNQKEFVESLLNRFV